MELHSSKTNLLRGIITEKLTTAAREILAAVGKVVAEYDAEASGFRQEIDRLSRELELSHPRIKVELAGLRNSQDSGTFSSNKVPVNKGGPTDGEEEDQHVAEQDSGSVSRFSPPPLKTEAVNLRRPEIINQEDFIDLRICVLKDWKTQVLPKNAQYPFRELRCPAGLQEADFLDLLRSTFPLLAAETPFEPFLTDRTRKLCPLKVESFTAEQVFRAAGSSVLYLRLKKKPLEEEDPEPPARPSSPGPTPLNSSNPSDGTRSAGPQNTDPGDPVDLKICFLDGPTADEASPSGFQRNPVLELQCPGGPQEPVFLDLLKSFFPSLEHKALDFLSGRGTNMKLLNVENLTPKTIEQILRSSGGSVLYVRVKEQQEVQDGAKPPSPSSPVRSPDQTRPPSGDQPETRRTEVLTRPGQEDTDEETEDSDDDENLVVAKLSSVMPQSPDPGTGGLSEVQTKVQSEGGETEDSEDGEGPSSERRPEQSGRSEDETEEPGVDSGPGRDEKSESDPGTDWNRVMKERQSEGNADASQNAMLPCKVCVVQKGSMNKLLKHAWTHVDQQERVCGVCGKMSKSVAGLRTHLQAHQKTYSCTICGKSLITASGFKGHMNRHTGNRPFKCRSCPKAFSEKSSLKTHERIHSNKREHRCVACSRSFESFVTLRLHLLTHTEDKQQEAHAPGKEQRFSCRICSKTFSTSRATLKHEARHVDK